MNIFVRADIGNGVRVDTPITETNTYTRCCICGRPIQLSLNTIAKHFPDISGEYDSFMDYFNNGFVCENCGEEE